MCCNNVRPTPVAENCSCLTKTLRTIEEIQNRASAFDNIDESCNKPFLGPCNVSLFNTRPVMFYNCDGSQVSFTSNGETFDVFRVESVKGCCVTCRGLRELPESTTLNPQFEKTDFCVTMDTDCLGALQCLCDTFVDCIH